MKYIPTIGLEIHVELKTRTKIFCGCKNNPEEISPNVNTCPICLGHPGTLPVPNIEAIKYVLKLGLALGSDISHKAKFDRKSYFYPDLPKGYQISQYDEPLVRRGKLAGVGIRRIHLEEDVGRLLHELPAELGKTQEKGKATYVDFNRAGVPLMELVTEPDIESGEQAVSFARGLQTILRYLDISDANMEKGQMRVEANISVRPENQEEFGTKVEVKNLNSFNSVLGAINFEIKRQTESLEAGHKISQETRGWDQNKKSTFSQRSKEEAQDYRYFPEPDIPAFDFKEKSGIDFNELKMSLPELPEAKKERLMKEFSLSDIQAGILIEDRSLANFFEEIISEEVGDEDMDSETKAKFINLAFNYLSSDLRGFMNLNALDFDNLNISAENFADLVYLTLKNEISSRIAKDLIPEMSETGLDPRAIIKEKGMEQVSDEGDIKLVVEQVIKENPSAVLDYASGKENAFQFLIGKTMATLKGKGNPKVIAEILKSELTK